MSETKNSAILMSVLFFVILLTYGCADDPKEVSTSSAEQKVLAKFNIARGGDPILLPVTFKDKEYLFLVDTGSSHTAFDTSLKHELGEVKKVEKGLTAGSRIVTEFYDAPEVFLGPFNLQDCGEVACLDLKMVSLVLGKKISGLLGMNFLKKYIVQIDYDNGTFLFLQPLQKRHSGWGNELSISYNSLGIPTITGNIYDSIKVDFWIDTGATNSTGGLSSDIFDQILSEKELKTSEELSATAPGIVRSREARTGNLSVGSFEYRDLIFGEANWSHLGLLFLSRHIVTLDFPNNRIYLKKGKDFKKRDETDMSGLHLLRISGNIVVYSVDEGSPAQKAGIGSKDVILKVNEKDASKYDMWELRQLLMSEDRRNITMTIKHGENVKDISFLLKKKI